jgi:hypothetical protein
MKDFVSGRTQSRTGTLFTQYGTSSIVNTTAETPITSNGRGSLSLPADWFTLGKTINFRAYGIISTASSSNTFTIRVKYGSTNLIVVTSVNTPNNINNGTIEIWGTATCSGVGVGGTIRIILYTRILDLGGQQGYQGAMTTTTFNTTAAGALGFTAEWSNASMSRNIEISLLVVNVEN